MLPQPGHASGAVFGEVVERVEQLLMRRIFPMTLNAVKELRSHVRVSFPGTAEFSR